MRILSGLLKSYICLSCMLIFLSFSGLPPMSSLAIRILAGPAIFVVFIMRWMRGGKNCARFISPWFGGLFIWLILQQAGIVLQLPFFDVPSTWTAWQDIYGLLITGFALYLSTEEVFSERQSFTHFIYFIVSVSAVCCVYFIYIYYTSGVAVEFLRQPFPLLNVFGDWGPVSFQPNNLVDLYMPGFFLSLSMILYGQKRKLRHHSPGRGFSEILLFLVFLSVQLAGIFFTNSRAGILSFTAGLLFYFVLLIFLSGRRRRGIKFALWILTGAVVFLMTLGIQKIVGELGTVKATVADEIANRGTRASIIGATWQLVCAKGFWGVGLGNFFMGWLLNHHAPYFSLPPRSYNDFLWFWAEAGLPGIILFAGVLATFMIKGFKIARSTESSLISYFLNASAAVLVSYGLHAMVDPTFYVEALFWLLAITLGIGGACVHMETRELQLGYIKKIEPRRNPVLVPLAVIASALVISFLSVRSLRAIQYTKASSTADALQKAYREDPLNPFYGRALALIAFEDYKKNHDPAALGKAVRYLDESLEKDPFAVAFYKKKAAMFAESGDTAAVEKTFADMHDRLPSFYLCFIAEAAFYMEGSLSRAEKSDEAVLLKAKALRAYQKAVELNPELPAREERFFTMTEEAQKAFAEAFPSLKK